MSNTFDDVISVSLGRIIMVIGHELQRKYEFWTLFYEFLFEIAWLA